MTQLSVIHAEPLGENVIELLEDLLKRAKAGEFSSLAAAYVLRDGSTGSGHSSTPSLAAMTGAVTALQATFVDKMRS